VEFTSFKGSTGKEKMPAKECQWPLNAPFWQLLCGREPPSFSDLTTTPHCHAAEVPSFWLLQIQGKAVRWKGKKKICTGGLMDVDFVLQEEETAGKHTSPHFLAARVQDL